VALSRIASPIGVLVAMAHLSGPAAAAARAENKVAVTRVTVLAGKPAEFRFKLSKKAVPHGRVIFTVKNVGAIPHTFKVCASRKGGHANACAGKVTRMLSPGQSTKLVYTFRKAGRYEYICTVPGHAAAGMKGVLKVT
jgi:uncharacterized cupredoxin-like copper-binding protein